jgi:hypothetical protein
MDLEALCRATEREITSLRTSSSFHCSDIYQKRNHCLKRKNQQQPKKKKNQPKRFLTKKTFKPCAIK